MGFLAKDIKKSRKKRCFCENMYKSVMKLTKTTNSEFTYFFTVDFVFVFRPIHSDLWLMKENFLHATALEVRRRAWKQ